MISTALTIAGSDPSGGAGIQADIKAMSAMGVYAMSAITALTAQNTCGVSGVHLVPGGFVGDQIQSVFEDVRVGAVKIGMIATADIALSVAAALRPHAGTVPIVLDPVMVAKGGHALLEPSAVKALREELLPLADVITPNLEEAAAMLETNVAKDKSEMQTQGKALLALGSKAVLLKGGHLTGSFSPDLLVTAGGFNWYESPRVNTKNTHGTGCTLSSAIAAFLAQGLSVETAVQKAIDWLHGAVVAADQLTVGEGNGPVHHFYQVWQ